MEPGETSAGCEKSALRGLYAVLAGMGLLLSGGGWIGATSASAATCTGNPCNDGTRDLQGFEIAAYNLAVDRAERAGTHTGNAASSDDPSAESMAPLLYLTPRVASILEDVFEDSRNSGIDASVAGENQNVDEDPASTKPEERPVSPLADTDAMNNASELYGPPTVLDNADHLPKFQRQMYRTDI